MMKQALLPLVFAILLINISLVMAGEARIAAAASLTFALEKIIDQFQIETGDTVKVSYASSGTLTRQIEKGAPFELFLSADETFIDRLSRQNLTKNNGAIYTSGRLVLFQQNPHMPPPDENLLSLATALEEKMIKHFAIPNPQLAPYGKIAKQALKNTGLWARIEPFLIYGENASQSAMFVKTQSVDGALLPESLAIVMKEKGLGDYQLLSDDLYTVLNQRMVLLNKSSHVAGELYHYMLQTKAQEILRENGFGAVEK